MLKKGTTILDCLIFDVLTFRKWYDVNKFFLPLRQSLKWFAAYIHQAGYISMVATAKMQCLFFSTKTVINCTYLKWWRTNLPLKDSYIVSFSIQTTKPQREIVSLRPVIWWHKVLLLTKLLVIFWSSSLPWVYKVYNWKGLGKNIHQLFHIKWISVI